jgi:hypothetical protein
MDKTEEKTVKKNPLIEMEIQVRDVKFIDRETNKEKKFNSYKGFKSNGDKIDVKFTTAVSNPPSEDCVIVFHEDNANISHKRKYPVLWISKVEEIRPIVRVKKDLDL